MIEIENENLIEKAELIYFLTEFLVLKLKWFVSICLTITKACWFHESDT